MPSITLDPVKKAGSQAASSASGAADGLAAVLLNEQNLALIAAAVWLSDVRRLLDEVAQKHPVRAYRCTGCGSLSPDPDQCGSCMADDVARVEIIDPQKLRRRLNEVDNRE